MAAITTTKRDLNQHTAQVLEQVSEDTDVVVTERGEPRWRLSAYRQTDHGLARLEREGMLLPPAGDPVPWPSRPGGPEYTEDEVDALLAEMTGDH